MCQNVKTFVIILHRSIVSLHYYDLLKTYIISTTNVVLFENQHACHFGERKFIYLSSIHMHNQFIEVETRFYNQKSPQNHYTTSTSIKLAKNHKSHETTLKNHETAEPH